MRLHILGICGTFMGSLAQLAKALGHDVSGSDAGVYPPMSDQLLAAGIELTEGFAPEGIPTDVDLVIIGNAMSRGNPSVEYVLDRGIPYTSGPQWLGEFVLRGRWVAAVAGTHGKTTTASMLAWILEYAGMKPGYLIGGVPQNFSVSARLGDSPFFVIEADEYDTAFFDKRSKFVHYQPRTVIMNNLEYDHADIFPDLAAIERQFHHLVRTIPASGQIVLPAGEEALERVLKQGCWTPVQRIEQNLGTSACEWQWRLDSDDASRFSVMYQGEDTAHVNWSLSGLHNVRNAVAAMVAARHMGVTPNVSAEALGQFQSVKRRMECVSGDASIRVYDDFAHHPTAIATTLAGAKAQQSTKQPNGGRLFAILEPRSNTMKLGHHKDQLAGSVASADKAFWFQPADMGWSLAEVAERCDIPAQVYSDLDELVTAVVADARPGDWIVCMSNGSFQGLSKRLAALVGEYK
ncbi:UDP-N-acetylmuramate:L-alanyl-gamma-D-glutamyl-meso-diaminopimelate ligase [Thalassolituus oleivorans]|uniref:UDP-N-acetylmuramate:L-alanyl-gamma-D-glutamyl- meso-diaminopimelate ligase n=1 Tax=Thalassolituus oleivorans TaxID=187493 RepID=UPI001B72D74E|nr:UDP-N-acetylmuramate:L-alanyl-gamma-D-glutamyl-meso-diaminopimelate ligase [Thalassolituus oleivorans]MBQ0727615.1 UDP-N-acetylmuramate:L-alanyl-gamma-D-glutamyl-meso-diaminopimelate ligase [Thalassolituus oleivorans]MBQ0779828.1 UDP-N-acetylmuramate:L-alanyl-gamma-D-glutamyl-meso-diaminopimelate ligase [Thalassolituus oleivorans]MDF1639549.1 UDP-N-acetylmuramate:L-alanyl-gamma-D-glutamyl-meso-diaminopimelate ligase [Thalassolituus oleivorans]